MAWKLSGGSPGADTERLLCASARRRALRVTRGGRFFHLHGETDKGRAFLELLRLYAAEGRHFRTLALGDAANDLELLRAADRAIVVPRPDGRVLVGSTMEEVGFEKAVTAGGLRTVLDIAIEIAPALARAPVVETWSNFRPASPDGEPILGAGTIPGLFYATGHTRNGILLLPITAGAIAAAVLGRPPPVDLSPFSPARLAAR